MNVPEDLVKKIAQHKCVVFVGAGLSKGAGLPSWSELLHQMLKWSIEHNVNLDDYDQRELESYIEKGELLTAAEEMRDRLDKDNFRKFMREVFGKPDLKPSENHMLLPEIPFTAALTSNYDTLLESAYTSSQGVIPHVITHTDCPELSAALYDPEFYVLKVHGTIDRIETVVLGRNDYRQVMFANPAYQQHLTTLFCSKTVLFLGFGLNDPDLLMLLDKLRVIFEGYNGNHYALMNDVPKIKQKRFKTDYGIHIISYTPSAPNHPEVKKFLNELRKKVCSNTKDMNNFDSANTLKNHNKNKNGRIQSEVISILLPIQSIIANAENIHNELGKEKYDLKEQAEDIIKQAIKLAMTMENMRSYNEKYHYESRDIFDILKDNINIFRNEASSKNIEIKEPISEGGDFPKLPMSYVYLTRAFYNVIDNAVKFSYFSKEFHESRYIEIKGRHEAQHYVISITNYGIGITEKEIKEGKIFEAGYRGILSSDRERTGSGIGLSEAKRIIERHGGEISISSRLLGTNKFSDPYKTTVRVKLPKFRD